MMIFPRPTVFYASCLLAGLFCFPLAVHPQENEKEQVKGVLGAIHGSDFYFIANSQIDNLNGNKIMDVTKLAAVRIAVVHLP
jgi:hypothetical protein